MPYLWLRDKTYWFRMRCPREYENVASARILTKSLRTDSQSLAQELAYQTRSSILSDLNAQLLRQTAPQSAETHRATINLARSHGVAPITTKELALGPLNEILDRLDNLIGVDPEGRSAQFAANLGGFDIPNCELPEVAERMKELCPDKVVNKNARQARNWHNRYKRAAAIFASEIADKPIREITESDAFKYRRYWEKEVRAQRMTTEYANKHFGFCRGMVNAFYRDLEIDKYTNPFEGIKIGEKSVWEAMYQTKKPEFTPEWIRKTIINGEALKCLNQEARDILTICASTGCRQTEVFDLPPSAIMLDDSIPHILVAAEGDGAHKREIKNAASQRAVPLIGPALEAMRRNPTGFPRYRGKERFSSTVSKFLKENDLMPSEEHQISGLRHSFESRMRHAGLNNEERGYLMGHSMKVIRGREVYGEVTKLEIRALYLELVSFETPYWKPREPAAIFDKVDQILQNEGFSVNSRR
jgi:site-specific recombinase XerD